MKFRIVVCIAVAWTVYVTAPRSAFGQTAASTESNEATPTNDYQALQLAQQMRVELASDVASGKETPENALTRLRTVDLPAGLQGDPDVTFAHGAIDVGQRLDAAEKKTEAGRFFQAAEETLSSVLGRTSDDDVAAKVQVLSSRAFIRAQFLRRVPEAIGDLDAAQKLAPDDPYLRDLRRHLLSDKAAWVADKSRN